MDEPIYRCAKCDGADLPQHAIRCPKRDKIGYYTVADEHEQETLCADCALPIMNTALIANGIDPLPTMAEAAVTEAAVQALVGAPGHTLTYSRTGRCGNCGRNTE